MSEYFLITGLNQNTCSDYQVFFAKRQKKPREEAFLCF